MKSKYSADGILTIRPSGDIDHHAARTLREEADVLIDDNHPKKVIIDLSGTEFMDSSGLGFILGRLRKCASQGISLALANPSGRTMRILEMAGADKMIEIISPEDGGKGAGIE
ncbi:Anti-sigma F factor antagonist [bioreactor metagenome]|uniref:Anti-sigma F factor antagonist n=1 Tax=bioreactor metagenome TaxID=1076179 RepID=A0A645IYV8_9ZZZZ|nr:STAS domain-containing protein [Oscillospiraceae bacterium]